MSCLAPVLEMLLPNTVRLKLDHHEAYAKMSELLELLLNPEHAQLDSEDEDAKRAAERAKRAVDKLQAHKQENDAFWPARSSYEELLQHTKRANYLTQQQYEFFKREVLDSRRRRLVVEGPPSCGKTFILVHAAVHYVTASIRGEAPASRVLLLCHSELLVKELLRCAPRAHPSM